MKDGVGIEVKEKMNIKSYVTYCDVNIDLYTSLW